MRRIPLRTGLIPSSLSARLTALALLTLLPISFLTVYSYFEDRDQRRERELREAADYAESVGAGIDNLARDLESLGLASALSLGAQSEPFSNESQQRFLKALSDEFGLLRAVFITGPDGRVLAQSVGNDRGRDLSSRPYMQQLLQGAETVWSGGLEGVDTGQVTVAHGRVIRDGAGSTVGFLIFAFYPSVLSERVPRPTSGNIVLLDQTGHVLYSPANPDLLSDNAGADESVALALGGTAATFRARETDFERGERFGAVVPIPTMNWALAYTRSQAELEASLRGQLARDLGLLAVIGAFSILALLLVARQVSRPLASLAGQVEDMGVGGDLKVEPDAKDPDIRRLQSAFVEMRNAVRHREDQLRDQSRILASVEQAGHLLASDLDFSKTVQAVTDAGVRVTEASFGALFYNAPTPDGEGYRPFTLSGAEVADFENFGMPGNMQVLGPTFRGEAVRSDDITVDPRFGGNAPHAGMQISHLSVRSYLSVPVFARDGSVQGGLVFGHPEPGKFTERHEQLAVGVAAWASIALNNARLYSAAQEREEELVKANRAKDDFLGLVSHELRTPITIILGAVTHLIDHGEHLDEDDEQQLLHDVHANANRLSMLVHNLLILARLDRLGGDAEPVLLRPVLLDCIKGFKQRTPERELRTEIEDDSTIVEGSALYVEQVVGNLLSNAHKYSPEGLPITLESKLVGGKVTISVRDCGSGLSDEDLQHLFEPYYRGAEARQIANGFGLGLAVCKALTTAMGGELHVRNHEQGGAVFSIALPVVREHVDIV